MGKVRIVEHSERPFANRQEAGKLLAAALVEFRGQHPLVLGIPRGGVVVAREVAHELDGEVDIALARKLRAPSNPELAIGAMSEDGHAFVDSSLLRYLGVSDAVLEREKQRVQLEIEDRRKLYRSAREKVPLAGRIVLVTDDGLATGATMRAALWAARKEGPARLICAVPVGAAQSVESLAEECDELICLRVPTYFGAVGQFYLHFDQTEDEEVLRILREEQGVRQV
jgi:putative phosphoribosyl transferase